MRPLAFVALAAVCTGAALAQTNVFRNDVDYNNSYGPAGPTGSFLGQPPASQWVRWPERGGGAVISAPTVLTGMGLLYLGNFADPFLGGENFTVQIYANDGGTTTGNNGGTFNKPGTLLWTSPPIPVQAGRVPIWIPLPDVAVPTNFTYTMKFQGGLLDVPPFDPSDPLVVNLAGFRFGGNNSAGSNQGATGSAWRRVFTSGGPSDWAVQERPPTFPASIPFNMLASFWSGSRQILDGFDNQTNAALSGFYFTFPTIEFDRVGSTQGIEGSNRKATECQILLTLYTLGAPGDSSVKLSLWSVTNGTTGNGFDTGMRPDVKLWEGTITIPNTFGDIVTGNPEVGSVTFPLPDVAMPASGQFAWVVDTAGVHPTVLCSPFFRKRSEGQIANPPIPTDAGIMDSTFLMTLGTGNPWGSYWFRQDPVTGLNNIATADFRLRVEPSTVTEEVFPSSFTRLRGRVDAGDVNSLRGDDTTFLRICRFLVPNDPNRVFEIDYNGTTSIANPTAWKLDVRSRATVGGLIQQTLQVFNYQTNAFDATDFNQQNLSTAFTTRTVTGTGALGRLVGPAGALRAKQTVRIVGPVPNPNFCKETSLVRWTITG